MLARIEGIARLAPPGRVLRFSLLASLAIEAGFLLPATAADTADDLARVNPFARALEQRFVVSVKRQL